MSGPSAICRRAGRGPPAGSSANCRRGWRGGCLQFADAPGGDHPRGRLQIAGGVGGAAVCNLQTRPAGTTRGVICKLQAGLAGRLSAICSAPGGDHPRGRLQIAGGVGGAAVCNLQTPAAGTTRGVICKLQAGLAGRLSAICRRAGRGPPAGSSANCRRGWRGGCLQFADAPGGDHPRGHLQIAGGVGGAAVCNLQTRPAGTTRGVICKLQAGLAGRLSAICRRAGRGPPAGSSANCRRGTAGAGPTSLRAVASFGEEAGRFARVPVPGVLHRATHTPSRGVICKLQARHRGGRPARPLCAAVASFGEEAGALPESLRPDVLHRATRTIGLPPPRGVVEGGGASRSWPGPVRQGRGGLYARSATPPGHGARPPAC